MQLPDKLTGPYRNVGDIFRRYWRAYGGIDGVLYSPYAHAAAILTAVLSPYWLKYKWWETTLSVVPSILGFTLAGFTIWLGFGDDRFQQTIATRRPGRDSSPYIGVSAGFVHFILVQLIALIAGLIGKATDFVSSCGYSMCLFIPWLAPIGHSLGFFLFVYSLTTALAATMGVFRTASWFEMDRQNRAKATGNNAAANDHTN